MELAKSKSDSMLQMPLALAGGLILFNVSIATMILKSLLSMDDGMLTAIVFVNIGAIFTICLAGRAVATQWGIKNNLRQDRDLTLSRKEWVTRVWFGYVFSIVFGIFASTLVIAIFNPMSGVLFFMWFILVGQTIKETKETRLYMLTIGLALIASSLSLVLLLNQVYSSACVAHGGKGQTALCEAVSQHSSPASDSGSAAKEKTNQGASSSK